MNNASIDDVRALCSNANLAELREVLCIALTEMELETERLRELLLRDVAASGINEARAIRNHQLAKAEKAMETLDDAIESLPHLFWVSDLAEQAKLEA